MRCFIAVDPSAAVREGLGAVQDRLRKDAPAADVRWTRPESVHLTLKFLGEVPDAQVAPVGRALAATAALHRAFRLAARGVGAFPNTRRPSVVWVGVGDDAEALARFAADLERAVAPLGFATEKRPFQAHLTIGRARKPTGLGPLGAGIERAAAVDLGSWDVGEAVLYWSRLRPTGAVYEALARVPLAG